MFAARWSLVFWVALAPLVASAVEVHSPAIGYDDVYNRGRNYKFDNGAVVLMAAARIRKTGMTVADKYARQGAPPDEIAEVLIDKLYFGSPPQSPVLVKVHKYLGLPADADRTAYVYTFTAHGFDEPLRYYIDYDADDQRAQGTSDKHVQALAQARLDTMVLVCDSIFVGRRVSEKKEPAEHTARVERVLFGQRKPGETVVLRGEEREPIPLNSAESSLYFTVPKKHRRTGRWPEDPGELLTRWSLAALPTIQAAVARREQLLANHHGGAIEVFFSGTLNDAIDLLGSPNRAMQLLGSRRLAKDGAAAVIPDLVKEIRSGLDRRPSSPFRDHEFLRQANAIELVGLFEQHRSDGEVVGLIKELFTHAEQGGEFPINRDAKPGDKPPPPERYRALDTATNHSLAWLLLSLKPSDLTELFGERLLRLRDLAQYGWKDEAQNVIDLVRVDDRLQLPAIEARSRAAPMVRWQAGSVDPGLNSGQFAFSRDGQWFAIVGGSGRVWSTKDWTLKTTFSVPNGTLVRPQFDADGTSLFTIPATCDAVERWDWRRGRRLRRYAGVSVRAMELSPDGKTLLVGGDHDPVPMMWVFDAGSGVVTKRFHRERWHALRFNPDGKRFLAFGNPLGTYEELKGPVVFRHNFSAWHLGSTAEEQRKKLPFEPLGVAWYGGERIWSLEPKVPAPPPQGKFAWLRSDDEAKRSDSILRKRRVGGAFVVEAEFPLDRPFDTLRVSSDGHTLVLIDKRHVEVLDAEGRSKGRWQLPDVGMRRSPFEAELSPDGRYLAVEPVSRSFQMYEAVTGKPVLLLTSHLKEAGHLKDIDSVRFSDDGGELITVDEQGVSCRWDSRTGALMARTPGNPPAHRGYRAPGEPVVERAEDGKYWIFTDQPDAADLPRRLEIRVHDQPPPKVDRFAPGRDPDEKPKPVGTLLGIIDPKWGRNEDPGLVPGGEQFYIGAQVYRRRDLSLVAAANPAGGIRSIWFSTDGTRYAVATSEFWRESDMLGGDTWRPDEDVYRLRVHETRSGATLFCTQTKKWAENAVFSPDGRKLAAVYDDLTIEVWTLPK